MRGNTASGKVVSSHASACGASSLVTKAWIDSRSRSCSSVKMKCRRPAAWSGLRTSAAGGPMKVDSRTSHFRWQPRFRLAALRGQQADCQVVTLRTPMDFQHIAYAVSGQVATIALDEPATRNALSDPLLDDVLSALAAAKAD